MEDRISMSARERDVLKVMGAVLSGERTQVEAARLLSKSVRQVRRIARRLEAEGDRGVIHRLRGRSSNHRSSPQFAAVPRRGAEHLPERLSRFWTDAGEREAVGAWIIRVGWNLAALAFGGRVMGAEAAAGSAPPAAGAAGMFWGVGAGRYVDPRLAGGARRRADRSGGDDRRCDEPCAGAVLRR